MQDIGVSKGLGFRGSKVAPFVKVPTVAFVGDIAGTPVGGNSQTPSRQGFPPITLSCLLFQV